MKLSPEQLEEISKITRRVAEGKLTPQQAADLVLRLREQWLGPEDPFDEMERLAKRLGI